MDLEIVPGEYITSNILQPVLTLGNIMYFNVFLTKVILRIFNWGNIVYFSGKIGTGEIVPGGDYITIWPTYHISQLYHSELCPWGIGHNVNNTPSEDTGFGRCGGTHIENVLAAKQTHHLLSLTGCSSNNTHMTSNKYN